MNLSMALVLSGIMSLAGQAAPQPQQTTTVDSCTSLRGELGKVEAALSSRRPVLEEEHAKLEQRLDALNKPSSSIPAAQAAEQRQQLTGLLGAVKNELEALSSAHTAWQAALDACEATARFQQDLEKFNNTKANRSVDVVPADIAAMESQLEQLRNAAKVLEESAQICAQQLTDNEAALAQATEGDKPQLELTRMLLRAESESASHKQAANAAETILQEARLDEARAALAADAGPLETDAPGTSTTDESNATEAKPVSEPVDKVEARYKTQLARDLDADARDSLAAARQELESIEAKLADATGTRAVELTNERELWTRRERYAQQKLTQAELHQRDARQTEALGQVQKHIQDARALVEQLGDDRWQMTAGQRETQADAYMQQASDLEPRAEALIAESKTLEQGIEPLQRLLPELDAVEAALAERTEGVEDEAELRSLSGHIRRMRQQLELEGQQAYLMIATTKSLVYGRMREATQLRELAALQRQCADALVPPLTPFLQRHRKIINATVVVLAMIGATYAVGLIIWALRRGLTALGGLLGPRVSVKRMSTLLNFAGSIIKMFVWVFGIVAILNEFGIDPAKSTGAIGLIGLIMAGMFQQIVVDFVKGLEIVAAGHYNVGDFIAVDGKYGHVVDFDVRHTRIRTLSGQECNLPNSKCIPSQRFPDGYVDNYVDFTFASRAEADEAQGVIDALCPEIRRRVEAVRGTPELVRRFHSSGGRVVLRYCLHVVPGCDWVAKDSFIPAAQDDLATRGLKPVSTPYLFYMNNIPTFRKLFNRSLTEQEILRDVAQEGAGALPATPEAAERQAAQEATNPPRAQHQQTSA